jgi:hypothetical protein
MNGQEPDTEEKIIRFVCGALFGALAGFFIAAKAMVMTFGTLAAVMVCAVLACGYLAMRLGDDFWH